MTTYDETRGDYTKIIQIIRGWPVEKRVSLMQDVLQTLVSDDGNHRQKDTWSQAAGLLAGPWKAPTDEEVEQILDESRSEKHG